MPVYKSDKGTYYASFYYTDWQGVRRKKKKEGFKTQREAKAFERQFIEKYTTSPTISFPALVDAYLKDCEARLRKSTVETKSNIFSKHILPFFSAYTVDEVTPIIVRKWQNTIIQLNISEHTKLGINTQLSSVFAFAVKYYNLPSNPVSKAGRIGEEIKRLDYYTLDEFRQVMKAVEDPVYIMILYLLFWTGMRIGEALALTWDDIDGNAIDINKTYSLSNDNTEYIRAPKTKESIRTVLLPSFIVSMLDDYKRMIYDTETRVFPTTRRNVARHLSKAIELSGIRPITIHGLRHSHASMLIANNVPVIAIAERLGHKDIQTTLSTYAHLYKATKEDVVRTLEIVRF